MSATIDPVKAKLETKFWELTNPANPAKHNEEKAIDVVAVHGLNGQPHAAHWENDDGSMWLCDLLPKDIRHVRVFGLAYDPKELLVGSNYAADSLAQFLLARLWVAREDDPKPRPLVFLAHGFGGFVVEKAINYLTESQTDLAALTPCIKKVIFLSTPQRAPDEIEWNSVLGNCMADCMDWRAPFFSQPVDEILELLRENKAFLQEVTTEFKKNVARLKIKIFSCYEEVPTPPLEKCSVNETNASLDLKLEKLRAMPGCNHISIAKYSRREDENYQAIMLAIKKVLRSASAEKPATKVTKGPSQVNISMTIQPSIPPGTKKPVKGFSEVAANTPVAPAVAVKPPNLQAHRQLSAPVVARDGSDPAQSIPKSAPSPAELPQSAPSAGSLPQPPDRNKSITRRPSPTSVLVGPSERQLSTAPIAGKGSIASQELPTSMPDQSKPHLKEPKRPNDMSDSVPPAKHQELDQGGLKGPGHVGPKQSVGITSQALSGSREGSTKAKKDPQVPVAQTTTTRRELDAMLPQKLGPAAGPPPPAQGPSQKTTPGAIQSIPTHSFTTTGGPASMGPGVPQQASTGSRELPTQSKPPLASPPQQPPLSSLAAGENVQQPQPLRGPHVQNIPHRTSNVGHGPAHTGPAVAKAPQQVKPKPVPLTSSPTHSSGTVEKGAPSHTSTKIQEQKVTTVSSNVVHGSSTGPAVPHPPSGTRQPPFQAMPPPQNIHSAFSAATGQPDKPQVPLKMSSPKGPIGAPTAPHGTPQTTPLITKQAHSEARDSLPTAQKAPLHSPATAPQAHVSGSFNSFIQNVSVHATSQSIHTQVDPKTSRGSPEHGHLPSKPSPIPPLRSSIHGPPPPNSAKHGPATGGSQGYTAFKPFTETQTTSHMPPKGPIPFRPGLVQHSHSTSDVLTTSSVMAQGHSTSAGVPTHSGHRHSIAALPSILSSGPTASKGVPSSAYAQPQQPSPTQTQSKTPPSLFPASLRVHAKPAPFAPSIAKSVPMHSEFAQTSSAHMPPAQPSRPPPGPAAPMPYSGPAKPPSRPSSMSGPPGGLFRGKHSAPAPSGGPLARPPMTTAATHPPSGPPHRPSGNAPPRPFTLSDPPSVRPGVQPTAAITSGHSPSRPALSGHSSQPPSGPPGRPTGTVPYRPFTMSGPPVAAPPPKPPGLVAGLAPGSEGAPGPGPSAKPPYRPYSISGPPSNLLPGGRGGPPPLLTRKQQPPSLMSGAPVPRPPALNAGPPKSAVPPNRHSISGPPPHSLPKGLQPGPAPLAKPGFLRNLFGANQPGPPKPQPSNPAQGRPPLGKPPPPRPGPGGRPPGAKPPPTGPPAGMKPGGPPKPPGPKPTPGGGYQPYRGPQGPSGKPPGSRPSGATPPHAGPPKPGPGGKPSGHHGPHLGPAHGPHHGPHHGGHHGPHHGSHHGPDHGHGPGHGHGWFDWLHASQHHPPGANVLVDPAHHPPETKPEETKPPETQPEETKPTDTKPEGSKPPASGTEETKPTAETKPEETKPPGSPIAETKPEDEGKLTGTESGPGIQATETESEGENKPEKPGSNTAGGEQKPQDGNNVLGTETSPSEQGSQPTAAEGSPSNDNKPIGPSVPGTDTCTGVDPTSINTSSGGPGSQYVNQVPVSVTAGQESTAPVEGDRSLHTDTAPHFTFIQSQSQSLYNMYAPYQPASTEQAMAREPETSRSLTDNTPNLGVVHPQTVYNAYPGSGDTPLPENAGQTPASDTAPHFEFVQPQTVYKAYPSTSSEALSQPALGPGQQYGFVQPQTVHDAPSAQGTPGFPNLDNQHLEDPHSVVPPPLRPTHTAVFPDIKDARPLSTSVSEGSYHFGFTESQTGTPAGPEQSFLGSHQTAGQSTSGYEQPGSQGQNTTRPPPVLPIHTAVFPDVATIPPPKSSEPNSSQDSLQSSGTSHSPQQQDKKEPNAPTGQRTGGAGDIGHDPSDDPAQKADIVGDEGPRNFLGIYYPGEQAAGQSLKAQTVDTHAGLGDGLGLQNKSLGMGPSQADATRGDPAAGHQYTAFFQSSPSLASHGINTPQNSSTIPYQARDISFRAQTTSSPLNPAVSTTISPPGEAATYYDSFEKPSPFPATNPQPTQPPFQAYQPYTSQAQPYQAQSPQPAPYTPYTPNQEQKKSSSGTALKVAAGVVAGAAVAGLATAGIMHALNDHDDSYADPTSGQTDASASAFPRDLSGAAPGPQVETASVSDLDDSDAYASTVDSSDLESIDAGSQDDLERSIHAEAQHVPSQDAEPSSAETPGVPFVGATPAPNPFDDNEDSDHHDHSVDSVADSSDLDSDDGHSDIQSIVNIDHQQESARAVDIEHDSHDPFQDPQMAPAAAQFTYSPPDEEDHDSHHDNSSVVDSSGLDTDDAHTDDGESEHDDLSRDLTFDAQVHDHYADHDNAGNQYLDEPYFAHADAEHPVDSTNVSDPSVSNEHEHEQDHDVPDSDDQSVSDSNYSGHRDIDGGHSEPGQGIEEHGDQNSGQQYHAAGFDDTQYDSDYEQHHQRGTEDIDEQHASDVQHDSDEHVEHGVEDSDAGDDSDEHYGETGYHTDYPYQGQGSDQEHDDEDIEVAGDEPQSQPGYWHGDDDEVVSSGTQHPSGYWEGDDDDEDENDANQHPAGQWEGDDDDDEADETNASQYPQGYWQGDDGEENDDHDDHDSDDGNEEDSDDSEDGEDNEDEVNTTQYPQGYWQGDDEDEDGEDDDSENDVEATDEDEGEDEDGVPQSPAGYWQGSDEDDENEDDSDDDENDDDVDEDEDESHYQNQYQQDSDDDEDDEDDDDDDDDEDEEPANAYQTQYYDQSQYQDYGGGADEDDEEDDDEDEDEDQGQYQQYQADYSQEYQQEYPQQEYVQQEYQQEYYEPEPVYQEQYQEPEPVYQQDYQQEYQAEPVYQQEYYEPEPVYQQDYQQEYHEPEPVYQQEPVYTEEQANYDYSGGYEEAEYDYGGGYDEDGYDGGDYYEEY